MAVLKLAFGLFLSACQPTAVLLTPLWSKSASSPRKVLKLTASQPSWQTARACGESAKQARTSGMSSKTSRKGPRFIECFNGGVVGFINESSEITPGTCETEKPAVVSTIYRTDVI